jgi:hypothetical protein
LADKVVPKEGQTGEYPMANFTPPHAAYAQHGRTPSVSTMATADLASRDPMMANKRASSGFGFDGYNYDGESGRNSGIATPYVHSCQSCQVLMNPEVMNDLMKVDILLNHLLELGHPLIRNIHRSTFDLVRK